MAGDFEGAGDLATGAMVARAVEPGAGEAAGHDAGLCLNCGTRLTGPFCHQCGQNGHVHRTVGAIGHDLLHGVLHLEGKTWRTLPMLAFRPGELTRRYVAGERARFVSPLAIFLFSVFLMFAIVAQLPGMHVGDSDLLKPSVAGGMEQAREKLTEERTRADAALDKARRGLAAERADAEPDADRIARLEGRVAASEKAVRELETAQKALSDGPTLQIGGKPPAPGSWVEKKWQYAKENPKLLLYKIKTSAYKFSWALIPISLPFIWLLFPLRRDVGLYDHAVFATYSLAFMSLLVIVLAVAVALGVPGWIAATAAIFVPPVHIYKQLKGAYGLSRVGALWRTFLMLNFALFTTIFFAMMLIGLGVSE